jgi:N-acetylglucosaminyl-diphospho-decaprenol L-rhamnosyltransferase
MTPPVGIDVVVPTFNGWELTRRCLEHLAAQTVEHTVIVSDDASTDSTPELVRQSFPDAVVVTADRNRGFASTANRGVATGSSPVVVLVNNDVAVRPEFLEQASAALAGNERLGAVAPALVTSDNRTVDSIGLAADKTLAGFPRAAGRQLEEAGLDRARLAGPSGGAAAYRRDAWEEAGGLDEELFFYGEDLDLALRLRAAGWEAAAAPAAIGVHLGSATIGARSPATRFHGGFSRGYMLRRYRVLRTAAAPRALVTELLVAGGDAVLSRDLQAARGRLAGWRAAAGKPPRPWPPHDAIEAEIGFVESLRLRWASV